MQSYGGGAAISAFSNTLGMTPSQIDSKTMQKSKSIKYHHCVTIKETVSRVMRDQNLSGTPIIGTTSHFKGTSLRVGTAVP